MERQDRTSSRPFTLIADSQERGWLSAYGIQASVGTTGDSYDNALAETINGLFKTEVIHRQSWRDMESVELATLKWVDWFNNRRLLRPIGDIPPIELENEYYRQQALAMVA